MIDKELEEQWASKEKEQFGDVDHQKYKTRMQICKECPDLKLNFCVHCNCFMPVKTRWGYVSCPTHKW